MKRIALALILVGSLSACEMMSSMLGTDLEGRLETFMEQLETFQDAVKQVEENEAD